MELKNTPPKTDRERMIESAFGWLRDVDVMEVDGKKVMVNKGETVPYNVAEIIKESDFIRDWLMLFALGRDHGLNYFPTQDWIDISGDGLQSVMITTDEGRPLFLIPPLIVTNIGPKEQRMLRNLELAIKQIAADEQMKHLPHASAHLAHKVGDGLAGVKPFSITDMVPDWYYASKGIIPEAEKQVNFIRQRVNPAATIEELNRSREIFYKILRKEPVTTEEKKFIVELTKGSYSFEGYTPASTQAPAEQKEEAKKEDDGKDQEFDPLEC